MTALVKLLLLGTRFFFVIETANSDTLSNSETAVQTPREVGGDPKMTAFLQIKLLDSYFFNNSDLVPIAIQTLGLSPIQTLGLSPLHIPSPPAHPPPTRAALISSARQYPAHVSAAHWWQAHSGSFQSLCEVVASR